MVLLKKIVIAKITLMALVCVFFIYLTNYKVYQLVYLFNLFVMLIISIYIFIVFKYIDNKHLDGGKYLFINFIACAALTPVMIFVFDPLMSVLNCLLFSLSMSDGLFFGLVILKYAHSIVIDNNIIKLMIGNFSSKKN